MAYGILIGTTTNCSRPPEPCRTFTYIDIGANIGATAIAIAVLFPKATIFAFEPVPANVVHLTQNIQANGAQNCRVIASAVGNVPSTVNITDNGTWSAVLPDAPGVQVPVVTLDRFCRETLATQKLYLIKIDVEGYEPRVLRGAIETLREMRPLLVMEFKSWTLIEQDESPIQFAKMLFENFEIHGDETRYVDQPDRFVHDNIVHRGCIDDLVMQPRTGRPHHGAFSPEIERLRAEIEAMHASTSWRITAPLRTIKTGMLKRKHRS